mgnify:CR=1 FL=1|jgi:hypothetical protein
MFNKVKNTSLLGSSTFRDTNHLKASDQNIHHSFIGGVDAATPPILTTNNDNR